MYQTNIYWPAIENAQRWFRKEFRKELAQEREKYGVGCSSDTWRKWFRENAGCVHTTTSIEIVDEKKYTFFLLKWS